MPTVEKVSGGRVFVRGIGEFSVGDRAEVSDADAQYLVEERGDFERVGPLPKADGEDDNDEELPGDEPDPDAEVAVDYSDNTAGVDDDGVGDSDTGGHLRDQPPAIQLDEGVCPWCPPNDRYEGGAVSQHAANAHPDEWGTYKED